MLDLRRAVFNYLRLPSLKIALVFAKFILSWRRVLEAIISKRREREKAGNGCRNIYSLAETTIPSFKDSFSSPGGDKKLAKLIMILHYGSYLILA